MLELIFLVKVQNRKKNILYFQCFRTQLQDYFSFWQLNFWHLTFNLFFFCNFSGNKSIFFVLWILQFLRQISAKFQTFHFCTANFIFLIELNMITINLKELHILTMNNSLFKLNQYQYVFIREKQVSVEMVNFLIQLNIDLDTLAASW